MVNRVRQNHLTGLLLFRFIQPQIYGFLQERLFCLVYLSIFFYGSRQCGKPLRAPAVK